MRILKIWRDGGKIADLCVVLVRNRVPLARLNRDQESRAEFGVFAETTEATRNK